MRKLILFLLVFVSAKVSAQVYQEMPQYGYRANRMAFDSTLQIPTVCGVPTLKSVVKTNKSGAIAYDSCNARFYTYNPKTLTWTAITSGSADTTSLSNRINLKIDSLKRSNDSVYAYRNGTRVFQFKDSVGGGGDFWKINGITNLTDNVTIKTDKNIQFSGIDNEMLQFYVLGEDIKLTTSTNQIALSGLQFTTDTSTYKPLGIDNNGQLAPLTSWVGGGGGVAVDTIFRTLGKDSIFYKKNNITYAIKDSVGGGGAFLPLSGGTLTGNLNGTTATFSSNGSSNTFNINHTSGSGHALEITKAGNGEGIIVNKTSGSGNAVTITGTLNATTLVKNGGTSSQFLKADGSVDATTYVSDTTELQRKSIPSYSFIANNTNATANGTAQNFKDTSGTYTASPAWNNTAPTSGNLSYKWTRIGKMVTINISLVYAVAGFNNSQLVLPLPSDAPTPTKPTGLTSALNMLYPCTANVNITNQSTLTSNTMRSMMRSNTANNGFEFFLQFASSAAVNAFVTCTYFTD